MHQAGSRRRSAAITLLLAGAAGLSGCGEPEPQQDVYASLADCQRDWGASGGCQPVRDERYSRSYYYGPGYYGASFPSGRPRPSPSALEAHYPASPPDRQSRSLFSRIGSSGSGSSLSRSSFGGGSSRSSTSRGGFGSSGRSFSSGG